MNLAQTDTGTGVIIDPVPSRDDNCKSRKFIFTINNYTEQDKRLLLLLCEEAEAYAIGAEIAPTTNTPHLQCYVRFEHARYRKAIKKFMKKEFYIAKANGTDKENLSYCGKENLLSTNIKSPRVIPILKYEELYEWQKSIEDFINIPLTKQGSITWIFESNGRVGKTELAKRFMKIYGFQIVYGGKCRDVINLAFNNKKYYIEAPITGMMYNLARCDDMDKISYKSMEELSDGIVSNTKFKSESFQIPPAHIIVFSNQPPVFDKMTLSRWVVYTIRNLQLVSLRVDELQYGVELRPLGA